MFLACNDSMSSSGIYIYSKQFPHGRGCPISAYRELVSVSGRRCEAERRIAEREGVLKEALPRGKNGCMDLPTDKRDK